MSPRITDKIIDDYLCELENLCVKSRAVLEEYRPLDISRENIRADEIVSEIAGSVEVTYRLTVDGHSCEKTYVATVVDVGYAGDVELSKYFVPTKGAATSESHCFSISHLCIF